MIQQLLYDGLVSFLFYKYGYFELCELDEIKRQLGSATGRGVERGNRSDDVILDQLLTAFLLSSFLKHKSLSKIVLHNMKVYCDHSLTSLKMIRKHETVCQKRKILS